MRIIGSTLPVQSLHLLQPRKSSFKPQMSPLNPSKSISFTESTRQHLANLDKLLQTRAQPDPQPLRKESNSRPSSKKGKGLLESLNLAHIWPKIMAAADEMSPRHLRRLQRLLSKTPEYSPRNNLGYRWREYHGLNDWAGLLDPLDENLRREVVRYGEFVQAAYHGFHSDPAMSAHDPPPSRQVALPDKSYKVTKNLYATSSIGLPDWVDDVAPDLGWMTQRSSWIGYVAVCDDDREIRRMGRRDVVIALRGTATCLEWAENVRAQLVNISGPNDQTREQPKVECGFLSLYKTRGVQVPSLAQSVVEEIRRLRKLYSGEPLSITVTGHSLGAALALLVAEEISKITSDDQPDPPPQVAVFSFGGPRVGNKEFANQIESKKVKVLRIVNNQDVITKVPLPAAYAHVGTELRVDTKMSPFLKPNADVACCHDLEAYLHLVDGFMASNCPFRTNAKRSLVRLMKDQGGNLKKLYTSKGRALSLSNVRREIGRDGGLVSLSGYLPSPHPE